MSMETRPSPTERARSVFGAVFGGAPGAEASAPGRVNLIGEHVDYCGGVVCPLALRLVCAAAARARGDGQIMLHTADRNETVRFDGPVRVGLVEAGLVGAGTWPSYVLGALHEMGWRGGIEVAVASDVPLGSGLSSSASLEVSVARAVLGLRGETMDGAEVAARCQRAEHVFAGVPCGIMDQTAAAVCAPGEAIVLDCRTLKRTALALPAGASVVVIETRVRHALAGDGVSAGAEYAARRAGCEAAAGVLGVKLLADATMEAVEGARSGLGAGYPLARHVVSECERVRAFAGALRAGELVVAGRLMDESHVSLRDDFRVSCPELDEAVELARGCAGVFGARMTGGGFGGCAVALTRAAAASAVVEAVKRESLARRGAERAFGAFVAA